MATNIRLKDSNGNYLHPESNADIVTFTDGTSTTDVQSKLSSVAGSSYRAIYDNYSSSAGSAWNTFGVWVANAYSITGYVTTLHIYAYSNSYINYGTMDIANSYTTTAIGSRLAVAKGWNSITLPEPVAVSSTLLFAVQNINYGSAKIICFSSTPTLGSYYYSTYKSTVTWQYYLDYVTNIDGHEQIVDDVDTINTDIYGGSEIISPTESGFLVGSNQSINSGRYNNDFTGNLKTGDIVTITHNSNWYSQVFTATEGYGSVINYMYSFTTGTISFVWKYGEGLNLRIQTRYGTSGTAFTQAQFKANVSVTVTRPKNGLVEDTKKDLKILFIGNSLTQDAVSYVPYLLQALTPNINFKIYMWYNGGYTLTQQLADFNNNTAASIFSVADNCIKWTNYEDSVTMADVLSTYEFDIVSLQEYFNYKTEYSDDDKQVYDDVISYIRSNYDKPFKVVTFFHQPLRSEADTVFNLTKSSIQWLLQNTVTESVIPSGIAIYRALSTDLDNLGDEGHLSPDGTHAQEGLPCLLQAYVTVLWIYKQLGISKSIINNPYLVNATRIYNMIDVPGANLGNGIVAGSDTENALAQDVAVKAFKEGLYLENTNLTSNT